MISKRHWVVAGALAISMHAAGFYAVFYSSTEGSKAPGDQGIEFDLGMMGDMGSAAQTTKAQEQRPESAEQPAEQVVETPKPEKPVEEKKVVEKKVEPKEVVKPKVEPKPEPKVAAQPEKKPEPIIKPKPPVVVKQKSPIEITKVEPKVEPKKQPVKVEKKPPQQVAQVKPVEPPKAKVEPIKKESQIAKQVEAPQEKTQKDVEVVNASPASQGPTSQANQKATTGRANAATTGGNPGAKAKYFAQLAAALAQNKRYPRASRRRNEEGVVTLSFVAYANGEVSDAKIVKSSGFRRLDKAVLEMLERATPLPSFSKGMTEQHINITLPVSFKLSDY